MTERKNTSKVPEDQDQKKAKGIELDFGTVLKNLNGVVLREQNEPEFGKKWTEENGYHLFTVGSYLSNLLWSNAVEKQGKVDQAELSLRIRKAELNKEKMILSDEERVLIKDLLEKLPQLSPGIKRQILYFLKGEDAFIV